MNTKIKEAKQNLINLMCEEAKQIINNSKKTNCMCSVGWVDYLHGKNAINYYSEVHQSYLNACFHTFFMPIATYGFFIGMPALFNISPKKGEIHGQIKVIKSITFKNYTQLLKQKYIAKHVSTEKQFLSHD